MINAADTKNAAAGIPSDSRHNPLMREREKHQEDYTSGMVLPTRPKKRKEGITMNTNKIRISMKAARVLAGMTEEEACTAMKIKRPLLLAWENGKQIPSMEHAITMADVYGLSLDVISFCKEDNKEKFSGEPLRQSIIERYGSIEAFCKVVRMKPETLRSRLDGASEFSVFEMERIIAAMNLNNDEFDRFFFTKKGEKLMPVIKLIGSLSEAEQEVLLAILTARKESRSNKPARISCGQLAAICKAAGTTVDEVFFS